MAKLPGVPGVPGVAGVLGVAFIALLYGLFYAKVFCFDIKRETFFFCQYGVTVAFSAQNDKAPSSSVDRFYLNFYVF